MSPIDARIPLMTRTPQIDLPGDAYSRALHRKGQVQQNKNLAAYGTQIEQGNTKREREARGLQAYTGILRKYTNINPEDGSVKTEPAKIRGDLIRQGYPGLAKKYEEARVEAKKKASEADIKEIQRDRESIELIGRLAGPVVNAQDPAERAALYQSVLPEARRAGAELPDELSDDVMIELTGMYWGSMTAKEQLDDEFRRREQRTAKQKEFRGFYTNWLEAEGKPRNAASEMEARKAFAKLGDAPEGRTVGVGDRIMHMNPATGEYDRDIGPRPPSQRAGDAPPDEAEIAKAYYAYLARAKKIQSDMDEELEAIWFENDPSKKESIIATYTDLLKAAEAEYLAIAGEGPQGPQGPGTPQGPGQPQGPGTARKRYNPRTRKLETY